jgi:hypothetical protein
MKALLKKFYYLYILVGVGSYEQPSKQSIAVYLTAKKLV